jgi:hypothetical protein
VHKDCLSPTARLAANQRIALAAAASGKQAGDIHKLFVKLDVPLAASSALKRRPFRRAELSVDHAIETVAQESCMEALELVVQSAAAATQTKSFSTKI